MNEDQKPADKAHAYLLSIPDDQVHGPVQDRIFAQLQAASFASLFLLSRTAQSQAVRGEATKILQARLREDAASIAEPSPALNAATSGPESDELPPDLATHRHFYKFSQDGHWVLTTRSGVHVATFPSEAELDQWWRLLKKQRGRILTTVAPK